MTGLRLSRCVCVNACRPKKVLILCSERVSGNLPAAAESENGVGAAGIKPFGNKRLAFMESERLRRRKLKECKHSSIIHLKTHFQ